MKQIFIQCFIPFFISLFVICKLSVNDKFNKYLFINQSKTNKHSYNFVHIESLCNNANYENQFLNNNYTTETIFLLGSSELTSTNSALPYKFIPSYFSTNVKAVGHAGNQCFSIFTQLLANNNRLKNAPIVFIISPGWFEAKPALGTTSKIFLEFNSERYLNLINKNISDLEFVNYAKKRISMMYYEFNSPSLELKLMNFKHMSSLSIFHKFFYFPLIKIDEYLLKMKEINIKNNILYPVNKRLPILCESIKINWDSLKNCAKNNEIRNSSNNNLGIDNDYFTEFIHGKKGKVEPVSMSLNQELSDFLILVKFIKAKHINAAFIISPLNPYYYKNLKKLDTTIDIIKCELEKNGFKYLNLYESDTNKYEKPILHDVMHLSEYGWYRVNEFIIKFYNLSK